MTMDSRSSARGWALILGASSGFGGATAVELARNGFRIVHLHPTVYDTPLIGAIDLVGGLSLGLYRRLTVARRRLARRYPQENAGFFAVCAKK